MTSSLHVVASTDRRGAEVFAHGLVGALERRGHGGELVALSGSTASAALAVPDLGGLSVSAVRRLRSHAASHDRLVAHGSTSLPAAAFATLGGPPFVYRSIGDPRYWSSSGMRAVRVRLMLGRAAAVVALFPAAADELVERGLGTKVVVIPNAIDTSRFRPPDSSERRAARDALRVDDDTSVVLYLGSISAEKGPELAIEACVGLDRVELILAGDGPLRLDLERRAGRNVRFVGAVDDPRALLWAADAVVIPSRTEGVPAAAIEAGACGVSVVATDVGGVSTVVLDGRTGRLVPEADVVALRRGLVEALDGAFDRTLARSHCVETFDLERVAEQWDELLRSRPR